MKKYLGNEIVSLRAIEAEDVELLYNWENDEETWKVSHTLVPYSKYILALYIKNSDKDIYETKQLRLMIDSHEGKTIGAIDLFDYEPYHSRAGVGLLIYNKEDRTKGYASAALGLIIDYCFNKLRFNQLYANIDTKNEVSLHLFKKFGFTICGTKKEWLLTDSGWKDEYLLQLINPKGWIESGNDKE
jgi:diamine N-acetyltransferase